MKPFLKFFPNNLTPALRTTSCLMLLLSSSIDGDMIKLTKINVEKIIQYILSKHIASMILFFQAFFVFCTIFLNACQSIK